ncbi:universal stress protein [Schlesneria paludicola]|uniref:universal stress protein n=1 Tax=Schlesneria paludicola TaxID=360056 RepID=UPI000311FE27|nr:universal stress protein [Schlesneria paludicola]
MNRKPIMAAIDVVLHPTDFSTQADQAFHLACSIARDHFARLVVLHVLPHSNEAPDDEDLALVDEASTEYLKCRESFQQMCAMAGDVPVTFRLVKGYPVGMILKVAREEDADLIVIASEQHRQSPFRLHGSVAEGVFRQSHCPVFCLRQPESPLRAASKPSTEKRTSPAL